LIVNGLVDIYGDALKAVYDKSSETLKKSGGEPLDRKDPALVTNQDDAALNHYIYGSRREGEILETGHRFRVDWEKGQKTGFFLDQRANRMFAQHYARNRKVLNLFCYSGAFSVYAIKGGATLVHSVDSSRQAIDLVRENYLLNGIDPDQHPCFIADAKKFAGETREKYDIIILDPPAFAKTHTVSNNALHAYIYINAAALRLLNPGGLLFTFSCSQAITRELFNTALFSAALESGRSIRILHRLSQGPDHPVNIFHPEGEYLKGLILAVE
jgi:23S rRNA (cytosine1962-C5)-methyltransferase